MEEEYRKEFGRTEEVKRLEEKRSEKKFKVFYNSDFFLFVSSTVVLWSFI